MVGKVRIRGHEDDGKDEQLLPLVSHSAFAAAGLGASRRRGVRANDGVLNRLLLCCPAAGCPGSGVVHRQRRRQAAETLRTARSRCAVLRDEAHVAGESGPLAHLKAAEQHLAAIERWLAGPRQDSSWALFRRGNSLFELEAESLAGLAREFGQADHDDETTFKSRFRGADDSSERVLGTISCSVLCSSFFYPGQLFLTSLRVCFHSKVMGVETSFECPWENLKSLTLLPDKGAEGKFGAKGLRVRIAFQEGVSFGDEEASKLEIRIFDHSALGLLHRCATYFTGSGLLESLARAVRTLSMGSDVSVSPSRRPALSSLCTGPLLSMEEIETAAEVWQLERRPMSCSSRWYAPWLPHDGQKKCKWVTKDERYQPHKSLPENLTAADISSDEPPMTQVEVLGGMRNCSWNLVADETTDEDGWQYAIDFYLQDGLWSKAKRCWSNVRRRRWRPDCSSPEDEDSDAEVAAMLSMPTMILTAKGLSQEAGGSAWTLLDVDLGEIPLALLADNLLSDDWTSEGGVMAKYFKETGAWDMEIGPWAKGGPAGKVKGKIRSIDMRVPVPPAPMCPKETRCTSTYHVVADERRIVLESVTMSLDVPYGDSFNVISADTFTINEETGQTRMVRTCGLDWVKSTWMRGMIEANVPPQLTIAGQRVADVVQEVMARASVESAPA
mmetsp:Transcript_23166/g.65382  ORF Transcript_23166/g.65382 Transcript_23166/m.65382 type:complete len:671 (+) Transcript_23166:86-2098(+)